MQPEKFNKRNVQYCKNEVKCLGLIFNERGVTVDNERTKAIK